jgi:hypothetical protein
MKAVRLFAVSLAILGFAFTAGAKKMSICNPSKGQIFNDISGCEVSLSEEHAKKGEAMQKIDISGGWYAAIANPKSFKGFDLMKFHVFNPDAKPMKLAIHIKFNDYSCPWEKRFVYDFMVKPGENDIEVEIMGATTVDGTPIDWGTKIMACTITGEAKKTTLYVGNIALETQEDAEKDDSKEKKK